MPNGQQQNHSMSSNVNSGDDKARGEGGGGGGGSGSGTGDGVGEGEEQEESSSHQSSLDVVLTTFRKQWQRELETSPRRMKSTRDVTPSDDSNIDDDRNKAKGETSIAVKDPEPSSDEAKAQELFMKGVGEERAGRLYEAIQWYRRAMQLVPDIESRLYKAQNRQKAPELEDDEEDTNSESEIENKHDAHDEEIVDNKEEENLKEEDESVADLTAKFQKLFARRLCICQAKEEQKGTHISALPMEILIYILRWVVSSNLDLRSLEACSAVSRGFFLCSHDSEIWRLACLRVWGSSCGVPGAVYPTWRDMFVLGRPRVRFDGCYVSKTTYVRPGENSFQDSCYRPWHLVEYFRYLRFYPGGTAMMLTTPDSPPGALASLRSYSTNPHLLRGHFRLLSTEGKVVLVLHRKTHSSNSVQQQTAINNQRFRSGRRRDASNAEQGKQSFHLEFQILGHKHRNHVQLAWLAYTVVTDYRSGVTSSTAFDLSPADGRFPPFWFSRVRSYTAETDRPLQ